MKYRNLIFDLDGTLWDSRFSIIQNWNQILIKYKVIQKELTVDDMTPFMGLLAKDVLKSLNPDLPDISIQKILDEIQENEAISIQKHGGILYENVENVLKELAKTRNVYIVSNCQSGYIEAFLDYFGFENLIKDFESHGRTGLNKSENIDLLLKRNQLNHSDLVYIGDTQTDFDAARFNGLDFIFCEYGFGEIKSDENVNRISAFDDLKGFID